MKSCKGLSTDFETVLKYAKRKYRWIGYFTIFKGTVPVARYSVLPYGDILPNDHVFPFVFMDGKWRQITVNADDWKQWIADVYHCSDCWGQKMSDEDMLTTLIESRKEAFQKDYIPDPSLYRECAAYWNELCDAYPN